MIISNEKLEDARPKTFHTLDTFQGVLARDRAICMWLTSTQDLILNLSKLSLVLVWTFFFLCTETQQTACNVRLNIYRQIKKDPTGRQRKAKTALHVCRIQCEYILLISELSYVMSHRVWAITTRK